MAKILKITTLINQSVSPVNGKVNEEQLEKDIKLYAESIIDACAMIEPESTVADSSWINQKEILKVKNLIK